MVVNVSAGCSTLLGALLSRRFSALLAGSLGTLLGVRRKACMAKHAAARTCGLEPDGREYFAALLCFAMPCFASFLHCGRGTASINSAVERPLGDDGSAILHPSSSLSRPSATHRKIMQSKLYMLEDAQPGSIFSRHGSVDTSTCKLNGNEANVALICLLCFALHCFALLSFALPCFA